MTVSDLLDGAFRFAIPAYQRAFSWTRDEAGQLLDDLTAAAGIGDPTVEEPDYFLGTVLLMDRSGRGRWPETAARTAEESVVDIVDGQQRLVTLSILAAVLRDLEGAAESELWSRLDALVSVPGTGRPGGAPRRFRLALTGKDQAFFERYILTPGAADAMPESEQEEGAGARALLEVREQFVSALGACEPGERRALATYLCERTHVVAILTTDVDRAHRYFTVLNDRGQPLLKSDILKAEVLSSVVPERAAPVLAAWDEVGRTLGAGFDRFFGHLKAIHGINRSQVITAVRTIVTETGGAEPFVLSTLSPLALVYRRILDAGSGDSGLPAGIERRLAYLSRLNGEEWVPSAMLALRRLQNGDPDAEALVAEIDRQAHLMRIMTLGGDKRTRRFAEIAAAIRAGGRFDANAPAFHWTRDELRPVAFNLQALWKRNPSFCKLLLLRVSDEIGGALTQVDPASLNIEHVLPQRPAATSEWRRLFPDAEVRETLTQSIGNLVVVPQRLNDAARNKDFAEKRAILGKHSDDYPRLAVLDDIVSAKRWGPEEIRAREARILAIVSRMLRIDVKAPGAMR